METKYDYDLLVIGSGPGGYVAAIRASQLGLNVAVIEKDQPGGVCLNIGCIPSKALLHQAELFRGIPELEAMGLKVNREAFDYSKVYAKAQKASSTLSRGVQYLLKKNKITYLQGKAQIAGPHEVNLADGKTYQAKYILIATGSRPREIPGFAIDEKTILSSTGALQLQKLPKKMLILGSGAIGVEFAHVWNAFGVEVHLVEMLNRILPIEDEEVTEVLHKSFTKRGIQISTSTKAVSLKKLERGAEITLATEEGQPVVVAADQVLVAVGRTSNTTEIGLEKVGIQTNRGFIPVGDYYQTKVPSIYAIGDVVDAPLLAHVASKEGEIAVEHMAGHHPPRQVDPSIIPSATYCEPQVASFGYPEWKAQKEGMTYAKSVVPYRAAGKSVAIEQPEGLVKVLYHPTTKEILGAHVVGAEATELIHELLLAKSAELLPQDIATMIHAHPTLSEAVMEVMRLVEGWPIHS